MAALHSFAPGGYHFLQGGFPYSQGVIAQAGFEIVRARFARPLPVAAGFAAIEAHLGAAGRPLTALCAAELRSPTPFTMAGFQGFNRGYVDVLERWGLVRDGLNPVARSNVCPRFGPPAEPSFFAFSYTVPLGGPPSSAAASTQGSDFVVAGSGEWPEGEPFPEGIVARGDRSAAGLAAKARHVIDTMRARAAGLHGDWSGLSAVQVYTVHDIHPLLPSHFAPAGLTPLGLTWHVCAPPILELEFEMDVRRVSVERML
ncbi:MAG: hypothetical protein JNL30_15770 [Rubrivivax sp.]|nr:hypothetical protein [Rubrivivax sp.]